jgi:two-component system sensor histidine kinase KdpD
VDVKSIIAAVSKHISGIFQWESVFLLPEENELVIHKTIPGLHLDADDIAVATWAYQHGSLAGYDTDTLHGSRLRYIPLPSPKGVLGVMGVKPAEPEGVITHEQDRILMAFANQTALALERVNLVRSSDEKSKE